jgi:predicted AlkP superfamily phosphohydrolase/phosphomutase
MRDEIKKLTGEYPVDVKGFRTDRKDWLKDEIYSTSRKHFEVVRHLMQNSDWDYLQFVEICLDRLQHGFWKYHDPQHVLHQPGNPYEDVIRDYYLYLDDEIGSLLDLLTDDTAILVMSDHGAQRLDGGFCINEWLVKEGLLVLNEYPKEITPFSKLSVNWEKTRVWSEGGYYARVFFNVKGREPQGVIEKDDYEKFREEVKEKLEALPNDKGEPMGTRVFKPDQIYRTVRNVAPDLIAHFGNLYWRSIGGVGYPTFYVQENDTGPDDCNHAQFGSFILAASNNPLRGEIKGAHILDLAPTLLELGGYDIPNTMQGKSLVMGQTLVSEDEAGYSPTGEEIIRERLSGLGYIS